LLLLPHNFIYRLPNIFRFYSWDYRIWDSRIVYLGAQESLLYDNLKDYKEEKHFSKLLAIATTAREIGLGSGVLIAGFITNISEQYNLIDQLLLRLLVLLLPYY